MGVHLHPASEEDCIGIVGRKQVHIDVGSLGKKKKYLFFSKSCQVKKQLYICSRLGKELGGTKGRRSQDIGPLLEVH